MQIKDDHSLKWPKPLKCSPSSRNKKKYCHFHRDYGHYTGKCRDLKKQIEELIQKGKLQKFMKKDTSGRYKHDQRARSDDKPRDEERQLDRPKSTIREIRMINRGPTAGGSFKSLKKSQQRQINNVHTTPSLKHRKREAMDMGLL